LAEAASLFDPSTAGAVAGRVTWVGEPPRVPPFRSPASPLSETPGAPRLLWPNPHAPAIDPVDRAVRGAVVFLRGVDPRRARPWDLPPVRVEIREHQVHVLQGADDRRTGVVRRGEEVELVSAQAVFHSLQARGDDFFARTLPDPGQVCRRRLDRPGVVELLSGAGYFWMRGHLFVADHPYFTHSDAHGHFLLPRVPPGDYELVCWLPDWRQAERELDADTGQVCRLTFRPPLCLARPVRIRPGGTAAAALELPR
jgi:hypothetical protein